jgi:hypothetical protein
MARPMTTRRSDTSTFGHSSPSPESSLAVCHTCSGEASVLLSIQPAADASCQMTISAIGTAERRAMAASLLRPREPRRRGMRVALASGAALQLAACSGRATSRV